MFSLIVSLSQEKVNKQNKIEELIHKLKLTAEQRTTIVPMLKNMDNEMKEIRTKMISMRQSGDMESNQLIMQDLRKRMKK